jgi:hypothetical protein
MRVTFTVSLAVLALVCATTASAQSRRLVGIGVGVSGDRPAATESWDASVDWFVFRIPRPEHLGIAWDIGSSTDDVTVGVAPAGAGSLRMRRVLFGPGYTWRFGRSELTASALAGPSFNRLELPDGAPAGSSASASNSFAFKPDVTYWIDLGPLFGLKLSANYLFTSTDLKLEEAGRTVESDWNGRRLRTQVAIVFGIY